MCCECGVAYASIDVAAALEVIRAVPSAVGAVARSVPEAKVRLRPDEGTWSVLEYVYHLRDVYAVYTPSGPTGPGWRNARCWSRCSMIYERTVPVQQPRPRSDRCRTRRQRAGLIDEAARVSDEEWNRVARRLPGEERPARWLVRQAMHEGTHHLLDISTVSRRLE